MTQVNVHEAKTHLSRLIAKVIEGEDVVIARDGTPVVRLTPVRAPRGKRIVGRGKGDFVIEDNFDAPLPARLMKAFDK